MKNFLKSIKWAIIISVAFGVIMLSLVLTTKMSISDEVFDFVLFVSARFNYFGLVLAKFLTDLILGTDRCVPSKSEILFFDVVLVLSSVIQGFLLGIIIDFIVKMSKKLKQ